MGNVIRIIDGQGQDCDICTRPMGCNTARRFSVEDTLEDSLSFRPAIFDVGLMQNARCFMQDTRSEAEVFVVAELQLLGMVTDWSLRELLSQAE